MENNLNPIVFAQPALKDQILVGAAVGIATTLVVTAINVGASALSAKLIERQMAKKAKKTEETPEED